MKFRIDLKILFFLVLFYLTGQLKIYLIILIFALLHEIAHILVGIILGMKPQFVEMIPFGFFTKLKPKIKDYNKKFLKSNIVELKYIIIAIAGPALNMLFFVIFRYINLQMELKNIIIYSNLLLLILNLIPIYPLDGGRILKSTLHIFMEKKGAEESMNIISNVLAIILTIIGSIAILYLKNIAVLFILAYLWELVIFENKRFRLKKKIYEFE